MPRGDTVMLFEDEINFSLFYQHVGSIFKEITMSASVWGRHAIGTDSPASQLTALGKKAREVSDPSFRGGTEHVRCIFRDRGTVSWQVRQLQKANEEWVRLLVRDDGRPAVCLVALFRPG